jgi:lipid-A-disaccharide synthase
MKVNKILILSGEISSDMYGAEIVKSLKHIHPNCHVSAAGGDRLRAASDSFLYETAYKAPLGLVGMGYRRFRHAFLKVLKTYLDTDKPDVAVIVDFQHIHSSFATLLTRYNIPIVTYITPNSWLWKDEKLARKIASYSRDIITIFEPEYDFYKPLAAHTHYFGHPLPYLLPNTPEKATEKRTGMPLLSLWPGSRPQEIARLLPKMLQTANHLHNKQLGYHFAIAVTDTRFVPLIRKIVATHAEKLPVLLWEGDKDPLLKKSHAALTASGTMTLHLLLYRVPMIILGALSPLSYVVAKYGLRIQIKHIGLPNILSHYTLVPEFIQNKMIPTTIAEEVIHIQREPGIKQMLEGYDTLIRRIFPTQNPILQAAHVILGHSRGR